MDKKWLIIISAGLLIGLNVTGQNIDVQHYRFSIELNDHNDTIYGKADILVKFIQPSNILELDLVQLNPKGKGMIVERASGKNLRGFEKNVPKEKLRLHFEQSFKQDDTATITIVYKGIPVDGLIISKTKYGQRSFFADNWPNRGHNWLPCNDHPADKAGVEFIITAPLHYQVVSNGIQVEETNLPGDRKLTHWKETVPISTKVMVIGVADFAVHLSGIIEPGIPVYSWVYPQDRDKGFYDYALATEIIPFFTRNIGPYPYRKLANVQSKTTFGGLENANTIFYSEGSVTGTRRSESLLVHEIAHQWFGNHATEKEFAHLWLSEGFATYMTILYMENKYGKDTAIKMLNEDRNQVIEFARSNDNAVVDHSPDFMQLLNANSYQKGSWVLHMLRKELGDSVFWRSIRRYFSQYGGKTADTDDLRKVFEIISGKDLKVFFQQWLYKPGIPMLAVTWNYNRLQKKIQLKIDQVQKGDAFEIPLEIRIGTSRIEKLQLKSRSQSFSIPLSQRPVQVSVDPNTTLLFDSTVSEIKQP